MYFLERKICLVLVPMSAQSDDFASSETVVEFVRERIAEAKLRENVGAEMVFNLPSSNPEVLEKFFQDLDEKMKELGVAAYGVSDTTLEEIFLQMVGQESGETLETARKASLTHNCKMNRTRPSGRVV